MAAGRAVVASRQGDIPELMAGTGLLVAPGDVKALRDALLRVGENPALRQRLGQAARARARDLSWDAVARRVEEVLCAPPLKAAR
jgi:glycosyltransferase involved in cell wall biosynthesis